MTGPSDEIVFLGERVMPAAPHADADDLDARLRALEARGALDARHGVASLLVTAIGIALAVAAVFVLPLVMGLLALACGLVNLGLNKRGRASANSALAIAAMAISLFFLPAIYEMDAQKDEATTNLMNGLEDYMVEMPTGIYAELTVVPGMPSLTTGQPGLIDRPEIDRGVIVVADE